MDVLLRAIPIAIGISIAFWLMNRRNAVLAPKIEAALAKGPLTLHELANGLGMGGFYARGKVVMALNDMVLRGAVSVSEAPPGTPQLQKVHHIRYSLRKS
jgi:hypothetical protein